MDGFSQRHWGCFVELFFPNQPDYIFWRKKERLVIQNIQPKYEVQTTKAV